MAGIMKSRKMISVRTVVYTHRIHGHGTTAQGARGIDMDTSNQSTSDRIAIGVILAFDEHDRGEGAHHTKRYANQHEEDVQPLERSQRGHTVEACGEECGATCSHTPKQGESTCERHQQDADDAQELCEETVYGHCVLLGKHNLRPALQLSEFETSHETN